ncbi:MAG: CPBP family intramembrane glutamic endopeptidase [Candidatus Micrarchaeia archaeon]
MHAEDVTIQSLKSDFIVSNSKLKKDIKTRKTNNKKINRTASKKGSREGQFIKLGTYKNQSSSPKNSNFVVIPENTTLKSKAINTILFICIAFVLFLFFSFIFSFLYHLNIITNVDVLGSLPIELTFISAVLIYLITIKGMKKGFAKELGLSRSTLTIKNLLLGVMIFLILIFVLIFISLTANYTNTTITGNSSAIFASGPAPPPIWFYFFVAIIAPIIEEITFRGFFIKRIGIIPSAIIFALLHSGYYTSISFLSLLSLLLAAFIFAVVAGIIYKKTNSIYPSIVAHILENSLATISFL